MSVADGKVAVESGQGQSENRHVCFDKLVVNPSHILPRPFTLLQLLIVPVELPVVLGLLLLLLLLLLLGLLHAPPTRLAASKILGRNPWLNKCRLAANPAAPAPMTATSNMVVVGVVATSL
jgi:hypothetical protein